MIMMAAWLITLRAYVGFLLLSYLQNLTKTASREMIMMAA